MAITKSMAARPVVDSLDRAMARVDFALDGTVVDANANFLRLMGYEHDEVVGRPHAQFVAEEERGTPDYRDFWEKLRAGEFQAGQFRRVAKDGHPVWIQASYSPVFDQRGKPVGVVKFAFDVTAKVLATQADRAKQQLYTQMVENTSVRLIVADRSFKIVYMNPASYTALRRLQHLLPCPVDDIIGKSIDIFHKAPERQRAIVGDAANLPHRAEIKLGDEVLDLSASAIKDADGRYLGPMVTWEIITEQVRAKEREEKALAELLVAKADLERKVKELVDVFTAASHGDLTATIGFAGDDDMGLLAANASRMFADIRGVEKQIAEAADQQNDGARMIAESASTLSEGSQSQAASVEEMTAAVEQLVGSIESISKAAAETRQQAEETSELAQAGGAAVFEGITSMGLI
ncbi:MAG: PAS domain S-box protein, partial [Planctomycetia bacterium]